MEAAHQPRLKVSIQEVGPRQSRGEREAKELRKVAQQFGSEDVEHGMGHAGGTPREIQQVTVLQLHLGGVRESQWCGQKDSASVAIMMGQAGVIAKANALRVVSALVTASAKRVADAMRVMAQAPAGHSPAPEARSG